MALPVLLLALSSLVSAAVSDSQSFDPLHHLTGDSPYFNAPGVGLTAALPTGCNVTHAAYLFRHSDIYASEAEYESFISPFTSKLYNFTDGASVWKRDSKLAFLSNWTSPITDPKKQMEKVTPYGLRDAKASGGVVAQRHEALLKGSGQGFKVWASSATRDQDTAKAFVTGLGSVISSNISLVVVEEGKNQSANTLAPHQTCPAFDSKAGLNELMQFITTYGTPVATRLNMVAPEFKWTPKDVYAAQSMCGYETVIRGSSAYCTLFDEDEWLGYEYASDLLYYYQLGYGAKTSPYLGMPWLAASARLLAGTANTTSPNSSASSQSLWVSFSHREESPLVIAALGLFNCTGGLPKDGIDYTRVWRSSNILPFLANVALERMTCPMPGNTITNANSSSNAYVRVLVNSAPIPLPDCAQGPGASCPLANFTSFIAAREAQYGNFVSTCNIPANATNATSTLGIYEGVLPDGVHVISVPTQGNVSATETL